MRRLILKYIGTYIINSYLPQLYCYRLATPLMWPLNQMAFTWIEQWVVQVSSQKFKDKIQQKICSQHVKRFTYACIMYVSSYFAFDCLSQLDIHIKLILKQKKKKRYLSSGEGRVIRQLLIDFIDAFHMSWFFISKIVIKFSYRIDENQLNL